VSQCGWRSPVINSRGLLPMRSAKLSETGEPDPAPPTAGPVTLAADPSPTLGQCQLLADMGESFRIGEAAVGHHWRQFD